jgi:hypothetical protein
MTVHDVILPTGSEALLLHNAARQVADAPEFLSDPNQWGYSVSFRVEIPGPPSADLLAFVDVDVVVLEGMIGVGVLDHELRQFISPEVDAQATGRHACIALRVDAIGPVHVMVRNTAPHGVPSRFRVLGATLRFRAKDDRLLVPSACPQISGTVHAMPSLSGTFDVLVSHTSRRWTPALGDRDYLVERYAKPERLRDLPPFDSLPPNNAPYHGLLTVCRIALSPSGVTSDVLQHYNSPEKIQHACLVGGELVVCFDSSLAVFARRSDVSHLEVIPEHMERVVHPWLGGLHTSVPAGDGRTCLVSSSGADAILWLDVPTRTITRQWRLPSSRYGTNYALDDTTWLSEHYISNDLQLGHLNCAAPDGRGGVFCSVLGQGDVGRVDDNGHFDLLVSGYVGCHGVRYDERSDLLYFCDSCRGRLMRVDGRDRATVLFDAGSRWLHDAVHLGQGTFLLTLGDTNRLVLVDTTANRLLAEWDFGAVDGTLQFLSTL